MTQRGSPQHTPYPEFHPYPFIPLPAPPSYVCISIPLQSTHTRLRTLREKGGFSKAVFFHWAEFTAPLPIPKGPVQSGNGEEWKEELFGPFGPSVKQNAPGFLKLYEIPESR